MVFPGPLIPSAPADMVSALGKNAQILNVVPSERLVLVRLGELPDSAQVPFIFVELLWQRLRAVMTPAASLPSAQPSPSQIATLYPNTPNPFLTQTIITFELGQRLPVSLKVYNLHGQEVATLWEGVSEPGKQQVVFNAESLPAGVYLCALRAGTHETRRLLVRGAGL